VIPERVLSWIVGVSSTAAMCVVLVAITSINQAAAARAGDTPALLNDVAHIYSLGVGEVRCASQLEWDADQPGGDCRLERRMTTDDRTRIQIFRVKLTTESRTN